MLTTESRRERNRVSGCARLFTLGLLPVLVAALFADGGANLPDFSSLSLEELSAVKVTSVSKKEQKLSQVAAAVYVMTQEEIHRSGMTNVADLLRLVPGITVARLDGSKWAVTSRGFNGRYAANLLVLIDGRSVYTPIFGGVYWDMSMPLLDDINRIEVIRGPGASIWGANAVNGVINIITKSAVEVKGTSVEAGGGTAERAFGQVRFGGNVTDGISYRTYLSASDHSALQMPNGQSGGDGWSDEQGGFRVDGMTKNGGWQLEADLYRDRRSEVGYFPSPEAGFAMEATKGDFTGTSANIAFEWRRRLTESSDLKVNTYYDFMSRPEPGGSKAETHTGDFEIQYHIAALKGHDITAGLSDRVILMDASATGLLRMDPSQLTYQVASGFVQDEIHFAQDRLLLTFGVKLEHDPFAGWQPQPTARVLWAPNKRHSAWAAVSRATQTPSIYERYMTADILSEPASASTFGLPVLGVVSGSSLYQPTILTDYEIGYRAQMSARFSIDIAGFYDCYKQLETENLGTLSLILGAQPYLLQSVAFTNNVTAAAPGAEISTMYHPFSRWKLAASYSHLDVHEHILATAPAGTLNPSQTSTPRNQWKIQSFLNLSQAVQLDTLLFTSSDVISPVYPTDVIVPPHARLDVRLGWRVSPRFEVSVSGQDLLNPRHLELVPLSTSIPRDAVRGYFLKTIWRF